MPGPGIGDAPRTVPVAHRCTRHGTYGHHVADDPTVRPFDGFPAAAVEFYQQLTVQNTREFWNAHRDVYESGHPRADARADRGIVRRIRPFKVFRPNRDMRFSKDKSPYKTSQGAVTEGEGGEFYYLHISADGLYCSHRVLPHGDRPVGAFPAGRRRCSDW